MARYAAENVWGCDISGDFASCFPDLKENCARDSYIAELSYKRTVKDNIMMMSFLACGLQCLHTAIAK